MEPMDIDDEENPPKKRQRETTTIPELSDVMRLAREMWYPTDPYKERAPAEEDRDFREWFGCGSGICLKTFLLLLKYGLIPPGGELRHFLWTLLYWKSDGKKRTLAKMCGGVSKDTFRKWSKLFGAAVSMLEGEIIVWENRKVGDRGADCLISVDWVDCRVPNHGPIFSSHKFAKKGGVRYEIGICIQTGDVVWVNGPFACGNHPDVTIFRKALISHLEEGERAEADDGLVGCSPQWIKCPKSFTNPEQTLFMQQRVRNRQETINKRMKSWGILEHIFRDDLSLHGDIFRGILIIEQIAIENGEPLFSVGYRNLTEEELADDDDDE